MWEVDKASNNIKLKDGAAVKRAAAFYADSEHQLHVFQYNSVFEVRNQKLLALASLCCLCIECIQLPVSAF